MKLKVTAPDGTYIFDLQSENEEKATVSPSQISVTTSGGSGSSADIVVTGGTLSSSASDLVKIMAEWNLDSVCSEDFVRYKFTFVEHADPPSHDSAETEETAHNVRHPDTMVSRGYDNDWHMPGALPPPGNDGSTLAEVQAITANRQEFEDANLQYASKSLTTYKYFLATDPRGVYDGDVLCNGVINQGLKDNFNLHVIFNIMAGEEILEVEINKTCCVGAMDGGTLGGAIGIGLEYGLENIFGIPGLHLKIGYSPDMASKWKAVSAFQHKMYVKYPGDDEVFSNDLLERQISSKDIGWLDDYHAVKNTPEVSKITFANKKFTSEDADDSIVVKCAMVGTACRGKSTFLAAGVQESITTARAIEEAEDTPFTIVDKLTP